MELGLADWQDMIGIRTTDVTVTALSGLLWLSWSSMAGCIVEGLLPRLSCLSLSYHPALVRLRLL